MKLLRNVGSTRSARPVVRALATLLFSVAAACGESSSGDASPGTATDSGTGGASSADASPGDAADAAPKPLPAPKSVVWIGAHPDDELYAAPWLGALCLEQQASCTFLVMTRGEKGNCKLPGGCSPDMGTVRDAELIASAKLFGAKLVHWDLGDSIAGNPAGVAGGWADKVGGEQQLLWLTCVTLNIKMTPVIKTQVYLPDAELEALHAMAKRTGRSVAELIREAIRETWLRPKADGPVGLWSGPIRATSLDHDVIYDEP